MEKPYPPLYYSDYLRLDRLLDSQHRKSEEYGQPAHDELLFIIVHQAYELWFKQILFEVDSVITLLSAERVEERHIGTCVSRLRRVTEIQKLLIDQLRILETMTPLDFLEFRDYLFPASGFQSIQFRMLENRLGLKSEARLRYNNAAYHSRVSAEHRAQLIAVEAQRTLFDAIESWLERTPFLESESFRFWESYRAAVRDMLARDRRVIESNPTLGEEEITQQLRELDATADHFAAVLDGERHASMRAEGTWRLSHRATLAALFISLYRDQPILAMPYRLIEALVDIDEMMTTWRYRHALMVHRMIGTKIGTGGSSGYQYLKSTAETHRVFADLTSLSTFLIPRGELPELPDALRARLGFVHGSPR
ncbi:MAG: tryptophan 2,3-dioxygenase family protein [Bacteroidota bacterium]|jgi:tryptophan 2,3-dioxygenase|nr:tryptophan 2,3-dioxygenase family protein [Bacteroidota bacterium]